MLVVNYHPRPRRIQWEMSRHSSAPSSQRSALSVRCSAGCQHARKPIRPQSVQGRDAAERAELAVSTAQEHSESALRSAEAVEAIAAAFKPAKFTMEWRDRNLFALRNTSEAPITITAFSHPNAFVKLPFKVPVTISPNESIQGRATSAHGRDFPSKLALIIDSASSPVVVPTTGRP